MTTACCLPALSAQTDDVARLKAMLEDISTLSADVVQLIMESDGGVLEESSIRMQLKRPNGFYWETLEPFPELIVTNGIKLWNYQPDLEQVVVEDWDSSRSELAAQLLSGQTDNLVQEYSIELVSDPDQALQEFQLTPKASDSIYSRISISYVDGRIDLIHLDNKNGEQGEEDGEKIHGCFFPCRIIISYRAGPCSVADKASRAISSSSSALKRK